MLAIAVEGSDFLSRLGAPLSSSSRCTTLARRAWRGYTVRAAIFCAARGTLGWGLCCLGGRGGQREPGVAAAAAAAAAQAAAAVVGLAQDGGVLAIPAAITPVSWGRRWRGLWRGPWRGPWRVVSSVAAHRVLFLKQRAGSERGRKLAQPRSTLPLAGALGLRAGLR
jgi:hypothetical protein